MGKYILAIDQGTTGTTAILIDERGRPIEKSNKEFRQIFPKPGWVEHDLNDIWETVDLTIKDVLSKARIKTTEILAIGITNQRETIAFWSRTTGQPIGNAIVWQCRRTTEYCEDLKKKKVESLIRRKTGLVIDPYFSSSKISWSLVNTPEVKEASKKSDLAFGTIDSFLLNKLTGGEVHATDVTNASRTQLMNIKMGMWDEELLDLFEIPEEILPSIRPSSGVFGMTQNSGILPDGIPISGIAGDQQAALFGQACFSTGDVKCTFGTGSFMLMNIGSEFTLAKSGCLTTVAWQLDKSSEIIYAFEGSAFICGAAVQWLRDGLQIIKSSSEIEELANTVDDSGGVEFVPALTGLGAPHWNAEARGLICGLTRGTDRGHIARATLEGMALQNTEILNAMEVDAGKKIEIVKVDGGASLNNLLMQIQSDYLGRKIVRPANIETTSIGAAYLAGLGVGHWKSTKQIAEIWGEDQIYEPMMKPKDRTKRLENWSLAIKRTSL